MIIRTRHENRDSLSERKRDSDRCNETLKKVSDDLTLPMICRSFYDAGTVIHSDISDMLLYIVNG